MKSVTYKMTMLMLTVLVGWPLAASGSLTDICNLIYHGQFGDASEMIQQCSMDELCELDPNLADGLLQIIDDYGDIDQQRQASQEEALLGALAELDAFKSKEAPDANSLQNIPELLSVIVRVCEFADDGQEEQILQDAFVTSVIQKAVVHATLLEDQGSWIEAYTDCYYWLELIDPNCSVHAQGLVDKAAIVAAFADSPCETQVERYDGVGKEMFVRAIGFLEDHYVDPIQYNTLAEGAIQRCKLLAEALDTNDLEGRFLPSDAGLLETWAAALTVLQDEVPPEPNGANAFDETDFLNILEDVLALNKMSLDLPEPAFIAQFSESSLSELDPYTDMIWPSEAKGTLERMNNKFTGIGIEIAIQNGLLTVMNFLPDTPAYRSDLRVGDVIERVNGVETTGMPLACAVQMITGPAGTEVTLTVRRAAEDETSDITIVRASIVVPTVLGWQRTIGGEWSYMVDESEGIGYVRLASFSNDTPADLEDVLLDLEARGLQALILDLRSNTGGMLDSAVAVADKFVDEGCIVSLRSETATGMQPAYRMAHEEGTHPDYPLVILVNSNTASASEIVAGALADELYERAILVGERTRGKGSVQTITDYPGGGSQLKYTIAYYYLPSGQRIESQQSMQERGLTDWGISPDVELILRSDEIKRMLDIQRDNSLLANEANQAWGGHTVEETLAGDPQLAVGLLVIRAKLTEAEAE